MAERIATLTYHIYDYTGRFDSTELPYCQK